MKAALLLCVLLAVVAAKRDTSKIALLKTKVTQSQTLFAYSGFKNSPVGTMTVKISKAQPVKLTQEQQKPQWADVLGTSPLKSMGYNKWMPVNGGMVFKNDKAEMVECAMSSSKPADAGMVLDYECKAMDKMRFARASSTIWFQGHEADSAWDTRWGPFDYPFYTTSSAGILGCKTTAGGFCTPQEANLFPFESCFANVNDAGELKAECEKKKKEREHKLDILEEHVREDDRADNEDTAKFFGKNFEDGEKQGMHMEHKIRQQQQQQEHHQQQENRQQEHHQQQQQQQQQQQEK